jgi:MFS superfamily sulfate permease-like transporter
MPIFDQRGQKVIYQYNAAGNINFEAAQDISEIVSALKNLEVEIQKAAKAGVVNQEAAIDAEANIQKAIIQAEKSKPDKKTILEYLNEAKALLEGFSLATGLVTALAQAVEIIKKIIL